jgi:(1->4)-alpha-D-glucan 1-alpha-D-glucosylmutase
VNEAKVNTHWFHPNEAWLDACSRFVDAILTPETGEAFLANFGPKAQRLAHLGLVNTLAQVALKITSPGVPDFYQGCEGWNLSLVDPDNRGLVDWVNTEKFAAAALEKSWRDLLRGWKDGGVKVRLTRELLHFRREHRSIFQDGGYEPLLAEGRFADRLVAYARRHERDALIVIVPRLSASLGCPPIGLVWEDTAITLSAETSWRDVLTGREWAPGPVGIPELFSELPLAVLWSGRLQS